MNLFTLAEAAKFVETNNLKDKNLERDHEYAISCGKVHTKVYKFAHNKPKRRSRSRKVPLTRSLHNELEKKRRAHMRQSQQELRAVVPQCRMGLSKHTMLGLLVLTRNYILELGEQEQQQVMVLERLRREEAELRKKCNWSFPRSRRGYSMSSESSTSSVSSTSSHGSISPDSRAAVNHLESICDKEDQSSYCDNLINIIDVL